MRNLADNLLTLLAALIIATVIWVIAVRIDDPIETRTYVIPVMTANLPASRILVEGIHDAELVEKAVRLVHELGGSVASPADTRQRLEMTRAPH